MQAQQRREVTTPRKPKTVRLGDEKLSKLFDEYVSNDWIVKNAYTPQDFIKEFLIDRHLARHYLMHYVKNGILFRVKCYNRSFYMKVEPNTAWVDKFKSLKWFDVEVITSSNC